MLCCYMLNLLIFCSYAAYGKHRGPLGNVRKGVLVSFLNAFKFFGVGQLCNFFQVHHPIMKSQPYVIYS